VGCILESNGYYFNHRVALLAGGVGGAKMARALRSVLQPGMLSIVVNIGDNAERHGVHVAADPDTVLYTLSDQVGPQGWGRADDTFHVMKEISKLGGDTSFTLGDKDFALCGLRASRLAAGEPLSSITADFANGFGLGDISLLPASDDPVETYIQTTDGEWLDFQTYFVDRHHADSVAALAFHGSTAATAAPGVIEAIAEADVVVIAPSNPPLSIWPILAIDGIDGAVRDHRNVVAVSPLFDGRPLKGPADVVMSGIGLSPGTRGILEAYTGMLGTLFIDISDSDDITLGDEHGVRVIPADTRLAGRQGTLFATTLLEETMN
jgi:LPPG:FO 2-phospho-L-lactate transferase